MFALWKPKNSHRDEFRGPVRLRSALAVSINTVAIKVTHEVGVDPVRQMALQLGIKSEVPDDLSIAGFDDVDLSRHVWPPLSTIHQPTAEIAGSAVDLLVDRLDENDIADPHRTLDIRLVERASTGPPR